MIPPPRSNVLGVGVHALGLGLARDLVLDRAGHGSAGYVCCCDVNSVSCAHRDRRHRTILNRSFLTTPDGMPVVWLARRGDHEGVERVYGPDLLLSLCAATVHTTVRHFFYGGAPGTAEQLAQSLAVRFPGLSIAGTRTPPYGAMPEEEVDAVAAEIRSTQASLIWVGLSTPLQEALMARLVTQLDRGVLLGVGAAFDLHSGRIRQAPHWMQRSGLEWIWRFAREPRRLGPRYLRNNPLFLLRAFAQVSGIKTYPRDDVPPST